VRDGQVVDTWPVDLRGWDLWFWRTW